MVVRMKSGSLSSACVVDLKGIGGLSSINESDTGGLEIGALTKLCEIASSQTVHEKFAAVAEAAGMIGSPQIRNRATIGGNLCNAAPSADMAPPLLALNATAKISGPAGERTIPFEQFFRGPGQTCLTNKEALTGILIAAVPEKSGYVKHAARRADIAVAGIAVARLPGGKVNIAMGAVAPTPVRAVEAEAILEGKELTDGLIEQAAETAAAEASPITDVRASDWYRRDLIKALTMRVVKRLLEGNPAKGGPA